MNRLNQVLCGLAACVVCQEAGMSMNQQRQDHPASMSIQDLRRQNTQKLIEVFSEAEIEQMRNMPKAEEDGLSGACVTRPVFDFGRATNIDFKVFYNLTNYIHSRDKKEMYSYLREKGIIHNHVPSLQDGLNIINKCFEEANLDQRCALLTQLNTWQFWVENICDDGTPLFKNDWYGTNDYSALNLQLGQQYACMFLRTLLLLK